MHEDEFLPQEDAVLRKPDKDHAGKTIRASISFPATNYAELERIATKNKVSVAWVVREAVDRYLSSGTRSTLSSEED